MFDNVRLAQIRQHLGISQEQIARLLGVSFASVNRWEGGHSTPTGSVLDIYAALSVALRGGHLPSAILRAANNERGAFLYALFRMAYGPARKRT